jgi:hypothetical protein
MQHLAALQASKMCQLNSTAQSLLLSTICPVSVRPFIHGFIHSHLNQLSSAKDVLLFNRYYHHLQHQQPQSIPLLSPKSEEVLTASGIS